MNELKHVCEKIDSILEKTIFLMTIRFVFFSMFVGKFITSFDFKRIFTIGSFVESKRIVEELKKENKNYKTKNKVKKSK